MHLQLDEVSSGIIIPSCQPHIPIPLHTGGSFAFFTLRKSFSNQTDFYSLTKTSQGLLLNSGISPKLHLQPHLSFLQILCPKYEIVVGTGKPIFTVGDIAHEAALTRAQKDATGILCVKTSTVKNRFVCSGFVRRGLGHLLPMGFYPTKMDRCLILWRCSIW